MPKAIGIDCGTTYSCVAHVKSGTTVEVIANHNGKKTTPSVVHIGGMFNDVGEEAQRKRAKDPSNTVSQVKRLMGRCATDEEITNRTFPFEVLSSGKAAADAVIRVTPRGWGATGESKTFCPEQITSYILRYMKAIAERKFEFEVTDAVITVPSNFNNAQRQATKDAAEIAGLNVLRIINEPTAAALAYGIGLNSSKERVVLVYDLGGGTFDVSIVKIMGLHSKVLSTAGITVLGGLDFDARIYKYARTEYLRNYGLWIPDDNDFELSQICEEAKKTLSTCEQTTIDYYKDETKYTCGITQKKFEELCMDLFKQTIDCIDDAIKEAKMDKDSIDDILLVGGSSRIPRVIEMVRGFFGDRELKFNISPDHAIAHGAALLADSLSKALDAKEDKKKEEKEEEKNVDKKDNKKIDVDVASSIGAIRLQDVLPHSLGFSVQHNTFHMMLRRNKEYPASCKTVATNASDNQPSIFCKILEGEKAVASENRRIGGCGIPVLPKRVQENHVMLAYSVDENGILSVHMKDEETNEEASTKVQTSRLTEAERMEMIRDARLEEESEKIQRAKYEARMVFSDAVSAVKRSVHDTDSTAKKEKLHKLVGCEEKWIETVESPSNDDLRERATEIKKKLAHIMNS